MAPLITLNQDDLKNIVSEAIKILFEDKIQTNDYTVDNFDLVGGLMNFKSDDDFYFVEIIKRKKDNPNDAFRYRQFISSYWITSVNDLQAKKQEIINTCLANNARAYIYMNPRSAKVVNDYAKVLIKKFAQRGKGYGKYRGHELEFAAGQHKDWDSRPITFLDIDIAENEQSPHINATGKEIIAKVYKILDAYDITPLASYKTPNGGVHIILPDKRATKIDWSWADGGKNLRNYATVHPNIDSPSLLFSDIKPQGYVPKQK